jgi:hypothetical protein
MEFPFNKLGYVKVGVVHEAIDDSVDLPMVSPRAGQVFDGN